MTNDALVTAEATVVLAVTGGLAFASSAWQALLTRRIATASFAATQEAKRASVDARSPRVVAFARTPPAWPPGKPASHDINAEPIILQPGTEFEVSRDSQHPLTLWGWATLFNEGLGTATVELPPGVTPVGYEGEVPEPGSTEHLNLIYKLSQGLVLTPQSQRSLLMRATRTIGEWVAMQNEVCPNANEELGLREALYRDAEAFRFDVEVSDSFADGVVDTVSLQLFGLPLRPSPRGEHWWCVAPPYANTPHFQVVSFRAGLTRRKYRGEESGASKKHHRLIGHVTKQIQE